jgi:predicted DNA-binding transcriptional regulator AlpA
MQTPTEHTTIELLDVRATCRLLGGSRPLHPATLYRGIKSGIYPRPVKLGKGMSRWLKSECAEAIRKLIAQRDGEIDHASPTRY